jgi:protocatechuate 3,4-dioxygenase alpha subunit
VIHLATPSQTVGPYFAIGMPWPQGPNAVAPGTDGAIAISGRIYDGAAAPIPDYLLETWQCDPTGHFNDMWGFGGLSQLEGFRGFARAGEEDGDGSFEILTVKPGRLTMPSGTLAAPFIDVSLFARGMLHRVVTRWYFADEEEANASDPVLTRVPVDRRDTLLAKPVEGGYEIDIHVQGPGETVFFAV